jgi:hypothetical protein
LLMFRCDWPDSGFGSGLCVSRKLEAHGPLIGEVLGVRTTAIDYRQRLNAAMADTVPP